MSKFVEIVGLGPLDQLRLAEKVCVIHQSGQSKSDFPQAHTYFRQRPPAGDGAIDSLRLFFLGPKADHKQWLENWLIEDIRKCGFSIPGTVEQVFRGWKEALHWEKHEGVKFLRKDLKKRLVQFSNQFLLGNDRIFFGNWPLLDELTLSYLICRTCYLIYYGENMANLEFPLPGLPGAQDMVTTLSRIFNDLEQEILDAEDRKWAELIRRKVEEEVEWHVARISFKPPEYLEPRLLTETDRMLVFQACCNEMDSKIKHAEVLRKRVEEFVEFCRLIGRPENHILVPGGRYVEKPGEGYARTFADMTHEMELELSRLPRYQAYVKVIQEKGEVQTVRMGRIQTRLTERLALPGPQRRIAVHPDGLRIHAIERTRKLYCKERKKIEDEISQRREKWQRAARGGSEIPPPTHTKGNRKMKGLPDEPPPISQKSEKDSGSNELDPKEALKALRAEVEKLMAERIVPKLSEPEDPPPSSSSQ